jgi:hypothetical protein
VSKEGIMNKIMMVIFLCMVVAVSACRKEDATPQYNYIGGAGTTLEEEEGVEVGIRGDVEGPAEEVAFTKFNMQNCMIPLNGQMVVRGFIEMQSDLDDKFANWCPTQPVPTIDFSQKFAAYYSEMIPTCVDVKVKGVYREDDGIRIDIEKAHPPSDCPCPLGLYPFQFFLMIDRLDTIAHRFNLIEVEKPCEYQQ